MPPKTLRDRFVTLDGARSAVLDRAYSFASYTIPRLYPERTFSGAMGTEDLPELYSSKPSVAIGKLKNKIVTSLFPPNDSPFFELSLSNILDPEVIESLRDPTQEVERLVLDVYQTSNYRQALTVAVEQAIVLADSLIFQTPDNKFKVYHLANFLIRRDGNSEIKEYWTVDWVVTELLDEELSSINGGRKKHELGEHEPLYTRIYLEDDKWKVEKEFRDVPVDIGTAYEILPYYHIGWSPLAGEDYSRGLVESVWGTIRSNEYNEKALVEGTVAGSEGRILLDPTSTTTIDDLEGTANWSVVSARPGSIDTFQPNVGSTIQTALLSKAKYEAEIDEAFLAASAGSLTQDRTTAFQVNAVASEKAQDLSGILTVIEQNLEPSIRYTISRLVKDKKIVKEFKDLMDSDGLNVSISSGIDALGRQAEGMRLESMVSFALQTQDPEMMSVLKKVPIMRALARNAGLDMGQFVYTEEEVKQRNDAARQEQVQSSASQQVIETAGKVAEGNLT